MNRAKDSAPKMAWELCAPVKAGEIVVFDKAYVDFAHLHHLHRRGVDWVTRTKEKMCFEVVGQQLSAEEMRQAAHMRSSKLFVGQQPLVLSDCRIMLVSKDSYAKYPDELRMVTARILADGVPREMSFITNNFTWSTYSICDLYASRWGIEAFFKEIKQTLQLADFLGTSENAIKWQIWIALPAYLLLRLTAWLHEWKNSFRRLYTLVKGMLWSRKKLAEVLKLIMLRESGKSPPLQCVVEQLHLTSATSERKNKI